MASLATSGLLPPVVALNTWTFLMEGWMYKTRLPAFQKIGIKNTETKEQIEARTPAEVRWKADNYNHLLEQPTQFYAITLALAMAQAGRDDKVDVALAWSYVGIRIVHSLVQSTSNKIMRRFALFALSSGVLATLTARTARLLWSMRQ